MIRTAEISPCGNYRYRLTREWDAHRPKACFVMLNPSTADALTDDPTIRKCIGFARRWGHGGIEVVNLMAWRETHPLKLPDLETAFGPFNGLAIEAAIASSSRTVLAWGAHGTEARARRAWTVLDRLAWSWWCLGYTKTRQPRHPLMLSYSTALEGWDP